MKTEILKKLKYIETQFNVRILYAAESGSRAWGFASPDSDYDVRFIYAHNREYYLSIDEQRDVIELPINELLDINGWDVRKALRLFRKSNGPLYEWLQSPIVYHGDTQFHSDIHSMMEHYFSPRAMMHHYLSMAKGVVADDLSAPVVKLKRYFYALRPVLAAKWIAEKSTVPPMDFGTLRRQVSNDLNVFLDELLARKAQVSESYTIEQHKELTTFINECIQFCEEHVPSTAKKLDGEDLNLLFRKHLFAA